MNATARRQSPTRTCHNDIKACEGEFHGVCVLPALHAGDCEFIDSMGMCLANDHCRAARGGMWRDNGFDHNHASLPYVMTNYNGETPLDEDALFVEMQRRGIRHGEVMPNIADVKAGHTVYAGEGATFRRR